MKTWLYGAQLLPFPSEERIGNKLKKKLERICKNVQFR